jgi:2-polyprenyl-3-methyl-5-hydroxy-6-metoxy-1,4-benzoquinol methylase
MSSGHKSLVSYLSCKICDGTITLESNRTVDGLPLARCRNCGLLFVRDIYEKKPRIDEISHLEKYYTEIATDKSKFDYGLNLINIYLNSQNRSLINQKLLDVGCGDGFFVSHCNMLGIKASGYDISAAVVTMAAKKGLEVFNKLEEINEKFDIITMFDVLEHMENPRNELKSLANLLKPNGLIFIETPRKCLADFYLNILEKLRLAKNNRVSAEHLQLFTNKSLEILIDKIHYKIINFENKNSLSWGGLKGMSKYVENIGISFKPVNRLIVMLAKLLIMMNIFGNNKAIILVTARKK